MTDDEIRTISGEARIRRRTRACRSLLAASHWSLVLLLASCASKKKATTDYSDLGLGQRVVKQTKDPYSINSPFQKDVYNASRAVKTSEFKSDEFHGKKGFFGSREKYKAGSFTQADKASHSGDKSFSGADDQSNVGDRSYKTAQSGLTGRANRSADQASTMAGDTFNPNSNPAALKGASNVKRPLILKDEPRYSEDLVKKLLNKG